MTLKATLDLTKAVIDAVEKDVIDPATGEFSSTPAKDVQLASDIVTAFKAAGVEVPADIDKIIAVATVLLPILGVK